MKFSIQIYGLDWLIGSMDNIYGDSYIVFAYHGDRIVGIRSLEK